MRNEQWENIVYAKLRTEKKIIFRCFSEFEYISKKTRTHNIQCLSGFLQTIPCPSAQDSGLDKLQLPPKIMSSLKRQELQALELYFVTGQETA